MDRDTAHPLDANDKGLDYYDARWYDAAVGRFLSEDPAADDVNLYRYCGNNPWNYTDPTGMYQYGGTGNVTHIDASYLDLPGMIAGDITPGIGYANSSSSFGSNAATAVQYGSTPNPTVDLMMGMVMKQSGLYSQEQINQYFNQIAPNTVAPVSATGPSISPISEDEWTYRQDPQYNQNYYDNTIRLVDKALNATPADDAANPEYPTIRAQLYTAQGTISGPYAQAPYQDYQVLAKAGSAVINPVSPAAGAALLVVNAAISYYQGDYEQGTVSLIGAGTGLAVSAVGRYASGSSYANAPEAAAYEAKFGNATSNAYRTTFFDANRELEGEVVVHHAVEQQTLTRFPNTVSETEINSLENLRGIPKEINPDLHLSKIRTEWNQFYRQNPNPTQQQLLQKATEIDMKYGSQFKPPVGGGG
jgi:RHS repeat-associated protein